jgi:CRP-like cAMP-binding protein
MSASEAPRQRMTVVERAVALRNVEAFRSVPIDQLAHVAEVAEEKFFPLGSVLFREGDPPLSLFVLLDGRIRLERRGKVFGEAVAGEPLGTWSMFIDNPRRATAEVVEQARMLVLDRDEFFEVLAEQVEVTRSLVKDLVSRLIELAGLSEEESS